MHLKIAVFLALLCTLCSVDASPAENRDLYNFVKKIREIVLSQNADSFVDEWKDATVERLESARSTINEVLDNIDPIANAAKDVGKAAASCIANQGNDWKQLRESLHAVGLKCASEVYSEVVDLATNAQLVHQKIQPQLEHLVGTFMECSTQETFSDKITCMRVNRRAVIASAIKIRLELLSLRDVFATAANASASCVFSADASLPFQLYYLQKNLRSCVQDQITFTSLEKLSIYKTVGDIEEKAVSIAGRIVSPVQSDVQDVLAVVQDLFNVLVAAY